MIQNYCKNMSISQSWILLHLLCKCVWELAALTFSVVNISPSSPC